MKLFVNPDHFIMNTGMIQFKSYLINLKEKSLNEN